MPTDASRSPVLIAVAPNGARRTQSDHSALPITPTEIADTAEACVNAGAAMLHLHVRDDEGKHSLDPWRYEKAIAAVRSRVGDQLLIQVSSEAAGVFNVQQQIAAVEALIPEYVSLGLREYIADETAIDTGGKFLARLQKNQVHVQYILYSPEDIQWYEQLCQQGVIPGDRHLLLLVLGRYGQQPAQVEQLPAYLSALKRPSPWMVCAFGPNELAIMDEVIKQGGHCRVGFENNLELKPGVKVTGNEDLVAATAELVRQRASTVADVRCAEGIYL
ncbi:3-keto-5-aminohexanoate cleavage protein [Porticoccus sp. GXU_MW_L64]